ncbi:MAG TPA: TPM domain-containing protein [Sphingomicrobium sp.]|nr:TPM domain-containing protein [Sphingomicrobium sp.]
MFDRANLLDPGAEQALTSKLAKLEEATSDQLVLVTLPNLGGEKIEKVALSLANRWGIGRKDVDNGVLILIAQSERKIRIEVGLGLEGLLTDARAAGVIRAMIPELREGEIGKAAMLAVDRIDLLLRSDTRRPQPEPVEEKAAA